MRVYRFVSTRFPDGLSCEGARRFGGRWNSKGVTVLYCASSESLAMLELRVHSPHPYPRTRWRFTLEVPDDALTALEAEELPRGWNTLPPGPASKRFGDAWAASNATLGLLVPSVIAPDEKNVVLNPSHPRFQEVRILTKRRIVLDKRLYSLPEKQRSSAPRKKKK
ncbi:MAG TPA: RES family NAD+ phosphorylase [Steroidobacteraceae bacterium]